MCIVYSLMLLEVPLCLKPVGIFQKLVGEKLRDEVINNSVVFLLYVGNEISVDGELRALCLCLHRTVSSV